MNTKLWGKRDEEQWQRKLWHQYHTELKPVVHRGSHARSLALYPLPCHCQASPWVLHEPVKPFINSNLSFNYAVRRPLNAQSLLCKVVCWQLCILKATEQWERSFLFIIISPAMIKERSLFDVICPLHCYPGRCPARWEWKLLLLHKRETITQLTSAGHWGGITVGSEKASITGAGYGSFPDRVAMGWALGTGGICGEGFVISNFAGYRKEEKQININRC